MFLIRSPCSYKRISRDAGERVGPLEPVPASNTTRTTSSLILWRRKNRKNQKNITKKYRNALEKPIEIVEANRAFIKNVFWFYKENVGRACAVRRSDGNVEIFTCITPVPNQVAAMTWMCLYSVAYSPLAFHSHRVTVWMAFEERSCDRTKKNIRL